MQTIEVNGKEYQVDTSQITLGDWYRTIAAIENKEDSNKQLYTGMTILYKALGDQIDDISAIYYGYVFGKVVMMMVSPLSSDSINQEIEDIFKEEDKEDKNGGV